MSAKMKDVGLEFKQGPRDVFGPDGPARDKVDPPAKAGRLDCPLDLAMLAREREPVRGCRVGGEIEDPNPFRFP